MEGIALKEYKLKTEINGKKGGKTLKCYPQSAMDEFWQSAQKAIDETRTGNYGIDMELAIPFSQSVTLEADGKRIVGITISVH